MITIGPYSRGEIPPPLEYQFRFEDDAPIPLEGFTAKFVYARFGGAAVERDAEIHADPATGKVTYVWVDVDLEEAADFTGEFWVGDGGTLRFRSDRIVWTVEPTVASQTI